MSEAPGRATAQPLRTATRVYIATVLVGAVVLFWVSWSVAGPPTDLVAVVVLAVLMVIGHLFRERDVGSRVQVSLVSIVLLASVPIVGPVGAGLISIIPPMTDIRSQRARISVFNIGMHASASIIGALTYLWAGGSLDVANITTTGDLLLHVGVPLIAADVAHMVSNAALLSGVLALDRGVPFRSFLVSMLRTTGPALFGYGVFGFLFVLLWIPAGVGPFSAVLIVAPLVVARWAYTQYGEEVRVHERTLSALVAAVETKNPFAAGHGKRVATLAEWVGETLALSGPQLQGLRYAAMLHDVGTVSIPSRVLLLPGPLTPEAIRFIEDHPAQGVAVISNVGFLTSSLPGVRHHHERFDGHGYPDGLAGDRIPLFARVVAVADTFDSLTVAHHARAAHSVPEALDILTERSSSQFDPDIVQALRAALDRHPWAPASMTGDVLTGAEDFFDHDDPDVSDLLAERRRVLGHRPTLTT